MAMTRKEIRAFVDDVYRQCADRGMTCGDFGRFTREVLERQSSVTNDMYYQLAQQPLPINIEE